MSAADASGAPRSAEAEGKGSGSLEAGRPRITAGGLALGWAGALALAAGVFRYEGSLIWLGAAALAALGLGWWLAGRNLRRLAVSRRRPARVFAGESFAVELRAELKPAASAGEAGWLRRLAGAFPLEARNVELRDLWQPRGAPGLRLEGLAEGEAGEGRLQARLHRRGRVSGSGLRLLSRFPLGLWETESRGLARDEAMEKDGGILVAPRPWMPPALRRELERARQEAGWLRGLEFEPGWEFRGIRDYRGGDPVKAVHWPATAREGRLMVREWDPPAPAPPCHGVILHTWESGARLLRPERWETILRVAAGLVEHCREEGVPLCFAEETGEAEAGERAWLRIPGSAGYEDALERLALARRGVLRDPGRLRRAAGSLGRACERLFVLSDVPLGTWQKVVESASPACPAICLDSETLAPARLRARLPGSTASDSPQPLGQP